MSRDLTLARELAAAGLPAALIARGDPLFAVALAPVLLFNPDVAAAAPETAKRLAGPGRALFMHLYTAAVALQARWRTRLNLAGAVHVLPDLYAAGLGLPSPAAGFGEPCLLAVTDRLADGTAGAVIRGAGDMLARQVDLAFDLARRHHAPAPAG